MVGLPPLLTCGSLNPFGYPARRDRRTDRTHDGLYPLPVGASGGRFCVTGKVESLCWRNDVSVRQCLGCQSVRLGAGTSGRWGVRPATPTLVANRVGRR